jgi:hypothetical protein
MWTNFENPLYISTFVGEKRGQGRWHLPFKSFMFLETVNKKTPDKLCFKVIENTCHFLTDPKYVSKALYFPFFDGP